MSIMEKSCDRHGKSWNLIPGKRWEPCITHVLEFMEILITEGQSWFIKTQ